MADDALFVTVIVGAFVVWFAFLSLYAWLVRCGVVDEYF